MERQPPPDLSLAIDGAGRRMTYVELASLRGISLGAARRLVLRHRWPRVPGNDGLVRVTVPLTALEKAGKPSIKGGATSTTTGRADAVSDPLSVSAVAATDPVTVAPATDPMTVTLSKAVDALCEQL